jgi:hypothetical protein
VSWASEPSLLLVALFRENEESTPPIFERLPEKMISLEY